MKNTPLSRQSNLVVQEMDKELLIYDLSTNKAYCLNETSALVYQLSDGKRTVAEISNLMSMKLKTLVSEDFVWLALNELKRDRLLENTDELKDYFSGITRRELVNKAALASMLALPVIVSVVSPVAIQAASCSGELGSCVFDNLKQTNCCDGLRCLASNTCDKCIPAGELLSPCTNNFGNCTICSSFVTNFCCNPGQTTNDGINCFCQ